MLACLSDPNFFGVVSFFLLVWLLYYKGRRSLFVFLTRYGRTISERINVSSVEKEKALLELTHANKAVSALPDEVAKIWAKQSLDFQNLHEKLEEACDKQERINKQRLAHIHEQIMRAQYQEAVRAMTARFYQDAEESTVSDRARLVDQSLDLLETITPKARALLRED